MPSFNSNKIHSIEKCLFYFVQFHELHAKWLNTLSFLENCGARMIAACEHPIFVKEEMLKHAAEEFRHAHYLKKQIEKVSPTTLSNYSMKYLLGGTATMHYLKALDLYTLKFLRREKIPREKIKEYAYLLVTYTIELRADELYPIYEKVLREMKSKVRVKSILLEEKEHLKEMIHALQRLPQGLRYAHEIIQYEALIYKKWVHSLAAIQENIF